MKTMSCPLGKLSLFYVCIPCIQISMYLSLNISFCLVHTVLSSCFCAYSQSIGSSGLGSSPTAPLLSGPVGALEPVCKTLRDFFNPCAPFGLESFVGSVLIVCLQTG